ncbi:hypothetical protein [Embleya sp. NBC_00896]|uniref:hypothetical protein n=1 Tax=Embleya sp. NBC_00896 TaxID=2975961 RepID=UPI002F917C25|nr:hypothetical protein OG928_42195 [Embleya sp. NBC_00896]
MAYNPIAPGGLDALAAALPEARRVSGTLSRSDGRLLIHPIAVQTGAGAIVVPDLAPDGAAGPLGRPAPCARDLLADALDEARAALAEAAHHGLRRVSAATRARLESAATALAKPGLTTAAGLLREFLSVHHSRGHTASIRPWVDAQLHVLVAAELHHEE